jgi:hypothetical protein
LLLECSELPDRCQYLPEPGAHLQSQVLVQHTGWKCSIGDCLSSGGLTPFHW